MCRVKIKDYIEDLQRCSVCYPAKIFFTSEFSYLLFYIPTHKLEIGTANRLGSTNSEPPGPIVMMGQLETLSSSQIILLHPALFCRCTTLLRLLPATADSQIMLSRNHFPKLNRHFFSSSNFTVQDHILRITGDALRTRLLGYFCVELELEGRNILLQKQLL
jgi:hypothetical protein